MGQKHVACVFYFVLICTFFVSIYTGIPFFGTFPKSRGRHTKRKKTKKQMKQMNVKCQFNSDGEKGGKA